MNKKEKLLLYCTKSKPYLSGSYAESDGDIGTICGFGYATSFCPTEWEDEEDYTGNLNGKIVAMCDCEKVEEIVCDRLPNGVGYDYIYDTETIDAFLLKEKTCLDEFKLYSYLGFKDIANVVGYALYLSNLEIFDNPKELRNFYKDNFYKLYEKWENHKIKKTPQNMCYCYDIDGNKYILLPIRPEYLVDILNGIKTIEVRRRILSSLKELIV